MSQMVISDSIARLENGFGCSIPTSIGSNFLSGLDVCLTRQNPAEISVVSH